MLRVISQAIMNKKPEFIESGKKWEICGGCHQRRIFIEDPQTKTWKCTECGFETPIRQYYGPITITPTK